MKELSLRQAQLPGKNVFYYSKYEEFSIEIMGGRQGEKGKLQILHVDDSEYSVTFVQIIPYETLSARCDLETLAFGLRLKNLYLE